MDWRHNEKKDSFEHLELARQKLGYFVSEACEFLCISQRTWYRWQSNKDGPLWAINALEIRSGDLKIFGWQGWYLEQGVLYNEFLNQKYYSWEPGNLMEEAYWRANGRRPKGIMSFSETKNIKILDLHRENKINAK